VKAILVIDMPNDADISKMRTGGDGNIYYIRDGERASIVSNIKNIKPLPQKKETRCAIQYSGLAEEYRKEGWNECLDAITGEAE